MNNRGELQSNQTATKEDKLEINTMQFNHEFLSHVNKERARVGVKPLKYNSRLQRGTDIRLADMISVKNISHTRPNGTSFSTAFNYMNGEYMSIGENVAYRWYDNASEKEVSAGNRTIEAVLAKLFFDQYSRSQGHYKNMIHEQFDSLSVASEIIEKNGQIFNVMIFTKSR